MRRQRFSKIIATLGPVSSDLAAIENLFRAGADVFRLNFSHGTHADHQQRYDHIRALEKKHNRPIAIIADLQGPKLRIGKLKSDVMLEVGQPFILDKNEEPGDATRVFLPHDELFKGLKAGGTLLIYDGKIRLKVDRVEKDKIHTTVTYGGKLTSTKGINVPDVVLPLSALTDKDKIDMAFALDMGADWIALSFVQKPDDIADARMIIKGRARIISKLEKPSAVEHLEEIIKMSDAVMVARGDLGVEIPIQNVPPLQKKIITLSRLHGRPVIVATQMLDSMVKAPTPTRAEASDVATAIYDGADAVMLSEETAAGQYPVESVTMMDSIIKSVEHDPAYNTIMTSSRPRNLSGGADAICESAGQSAEILNAAALVSYTTTGGTALRIARLRHLIPTVSISNDVRTARYLALGWGIHSVKSHDAESFEEMVDTACHVILSEGIGATGDTIIITAGTPFGTPGATNVMRITTVEKSHASA